MNKFYKFILPAIFYFSHALGQVSYFYPYTILNQRANDMVYDSAISQLLISIPSTDVVHGNAIGFIKTDSALFKGSYFIGSEPGPLAMTYNAKYLYVGINAAGSIKKFDITSRTAVQNFTVGNDSFYGPMHAANISCQPGNDSIIAVAREFQAVSPAYAPAAIFKNGSPLPITISQYSVGMDVVHFQSPSILYGYNNQTTGYDFSKMAVTSNGLQLINDIGSLIYGFYVQFYIQGTMAVSDLGRAVDLSGPSPVALGIYNLGNSYSNKVCFDPYAGLTCFASKDFSSNTVTIRRFRTNTFLKYDSLVIPGITDDVKRIITLGDSSNYAFCTVGNQLVIVGSGLKTGIRSYDIKKEFIDLYPNPTNGEVFYKGPSSVNVEVFNSTGSKVEFTQKENSLSLEQLPNGIYQVIIKDTKGELLGTKKVIKN